MKVIQKFFNSCYVFKQKNFIDKRGKFVELFNKKIFKKYIKKNIEFVQLNYSISKKNVLRGLHFQKKPFAQSKILRVLCGEIFDVIVDLRDKSKTFGKYKSLIISKKNQKQIFIPEGFAHGFLVLSKYAEIEYICSNYYSKKHEVTLDSKDRDLKINWPSNKILLSDKDKNGLSLNKIKQILKSAKNENK